LSCAPVLPKEWQCLLEEPFCGLPVALSCCLPGCRPERVGSHWGGDIGAALETSMHWIDREIARLPV
ncbi:MAG: hypothetical protein ACREVB_06750, partial [Burkholderiales bacterium]